MSEFKHCQVLGPFNTGTVLMTSYVRQLFSNNRQKRFEYWKHSLPPRYQRNADDKMVTIDSADAFSGVLFLCMVRSPYFWLAATSRRPYNLNFHVKSFDVGQRLRSPVRLKDENFNNIVHLWNSYYRRYALYLEKQAEVIYTRLEDLVRNPRDILRVLESKLDRKPGSDVQASIDSMAQTPRKADNAFGEIWEEKNRLKFVSQTMRAEDLSFINQQLDPLLMKKFAYAYVWPDPEINFAGNESSSACWRYLPLSAFPGNVYRSRFQ